MAYDENLADRIRDQAPARSVGGARHDLRPLTPRQAVATRRLRERDVELARQISAAAHELEVPADPAAVQTVRVSVDALVGPVVGPGRR